MRWLIPIAATGIVSFYLRFLWAMNKELKNLRKRRPNCRTSHPAVRRNLFKIDPADLWAKKSDVDSWRIKDNF
jgi:hypothetical protein